jgi:hypothetical protein
MVLKKYVENLQAHDQMLSENFSIRRKAFEGCSLVQYRWPSREEIFLTNKKVDVLKKYVKLIIS